jgi:hypothetical protein
MEVFLKQGTTINAVILIKILISFFQEMYIGSCIHRIIQSTLRINITQCVKKETEKAVQRNLITCWNEIQTFLDIMLCGLANKW